MAPITKTLLTALAVSVLGVSATPTIFARSTSPAAKTKYLNDHNNLRADHGAAALVWNTTLANAAQKWASGCVFEHSGGTLGPYGENLAAGTGDYTIADALIDGWAAEASSYDASDPVASHFTQMVWKNTKQLGCAVASCNGIFPASYGVANYYVCEYYPAGNVIGEFAKNVQA